MHRSRISKSNTTPFSPAAAIALGLLRLYKLFLSPLFTGSCRFYPSCADYMREAIQVHGAPRGLWLGTRRLARCHPLGSHGVDPVPAAARMDGTTTERPVAVRDARTSN